jgi:hypothetical protein
VTAAAVDAEGAVALSSSFYAGQSFDVVLGVSCPEAVTGAQLFLENWDKDKLPRPRWLLATFDIEAGLGTGLSVPVTMPGPESVPRLTQTGWYNLTLTAGDCYDGLLYGDTRAEPLPDNSTYFRNVVPYALPVQGGTAACSFSKSNGDANAKYLTCDAFLADGDATSITPFIGSEDFELVLLDIRLAPATATDGCGPPVPIAVDSRYYRVRDNYVGSTVEKSKLQWTCAIGSKSTTGEVCNPIDAATHPLYKFWPEPAGPVGPYYFVIAQMSREPGKECPCLVLRMKMEVNDRDVYTYNLQVTRWDTNRNMTAVAEWQADAKFGNDTRFADTQWLDVLALPEANNSLPTNVAVPSERGCAGFVDLCPLGSIGCECRQGFPFCNGDPSIVKCSVGTKTCFDSSVPTPPPPTPFPIQYQADCSSDNVLACMALCGEGGVKRCDCKPDSEQVDAVCLTEEAKKTFLEKNPNFIRTFAIITGSILGVIALAVAFYGYRRRQARRRMVEELDQDSAFDDMASKYLDATGQGAAASGASPVGPTPPTAGPAGPPAGGEGVGFPCEVCGNRYTTQEDLAYHRSKRGHGAAPAKPPKSQPSTYNDMWASPAGSGGSVGSSQPQGGWGGSMGGPGAAAAMQQQQQQWGGSFSAGSGGNMWGGQPGQQSPQQSGGNMWDASQQQQQSGGSMWGHPGGSGGNMWGGQQTSAYPNGGLFG